MFLRNGASCVCWRRSFSMYYVRTVSTLLFSGCESERRSLGYTGPTYMYFGTRARLFCGQQQTTPAILIHPIYGHLGGSGGEKMQQGAVQVSLLFAGSPCSAPERPKLFTPLTSRGLASKMVGRGFLERGRVIWATGKCRLRPIPTPSPDETLQFEDERFCRFISRRTDSPSPSQYSILSTASNSCVRQVWGWHPTAGRVHAMMWSRPGKLTQGLANKACQDLLCGLEFDSDPAGEPL